MLRKRNEFPLSLKHWSFLWEFCWSTMSQMTVVKIASSQRCIKSIKQGGVTYKNTLEQSRMVVFWNACSFFSFKSIIMACLHLRFQFIHFFLNKYRPYLSWESLKALWNCSCSPPWSQVVLNGSVNVFALLTILFAFLVFRVSPAVIESFSSFNIMKRIHIVSNLIHFQNQ